jgi:hypothetical protein
VRIRTRATVSNATRIDGADSQRARSVTSPRRVCGIHPGDSIADRDQQRDGEDHCCAQRQAVNTRSKPGPLDTGRCSKACTYKEQDQTVPGGIALPSTAASGAAVWA